MNILRFAQASRATGTVAGNAATKLISTNSIRSGVRIHNASTTLDLWVRYVVRNDSAPTISITDKDFSIGPGATLVDYPGEAVDVYGQNSSGAATTSAYSSTEIAV